MKVSAEYKTGSNNREIKHIVNEIELGNIRIPGFQRGYTWDRQKTTRLMDSLYQGYPIGIVTFWTQRDENDRSVRMIVDGQQRLTTIYACFKDAEPPHQHTNRRELPIGMHFSPKQQLFKFPSRSDQREDHTWIRVTEVLQDDENIMNWERKVEADGSSKEEIRRYYLYIRKLASVRDREIKEQEIDANLNPEQVIKIFDRINAQGKRLTRGELEMAWISIRCPDARERITDEVERWSNTAMSRAVSEESVIRSMAAIYTGRYQTEGFKESKPTPEQILQIIKRVETFHDAIRSLLEDRLGVTDPRAVPSSASFTIISKFLNQNGSKFSSAAAQNGVVKTPRKETDPCVTTGKST